MSHSFFNRRPGRFVFCLLTILLAGSGLAYAQNQPGDNLPKAVVERLRSERPRRLNREGNPVPVSTKPGKHAPDQLIVRFHSGTIRLPLDRAKAASNEIGAPERVGKLLQSIRARGLRKVFPDFQSTDTLQTLESGEQVTLPDLSQTFVIELPPASDVPAVVQLFEALPEVLYAEPNYTFKLDGITPQDDSFLSYRKTQMLPIGMLSTPLDPRFLEQWGLGPASSNGIDAEQAWNLQAGSSAVRIGILDSGIDYLHQDLGGAIGSSAKVVAGYDYIRSDSDPRDEYYHGTFVAGIAGALTNNITTNGVREGIAGVAGGWGYDARNGSGNKGALLVALSVGGFGWEGFVDTGSRAIMDCADGTRYDCDAMNASWGDYIYSETLRSAVNYAARSRRVFVAAKGNDGWSTLHYPSDFDSDWIISVGASDRYGVRPGWSNFGNDIDIVAPGDNILSTTPTYYTSGMSNEGVWANYSVGSGTSAAAPHVSGLAALLLSKNSALHPQDVEGIIKASATDKGDPGYDIYYGNGLVNARKALEMLEQPWRIDQYTKYGGNIVASSDVYKTTFLIATGNLAPGVYLVKRHEVRTTAYYEQPYSQTPYVWGRGPGTGTGVGWGSESPNYQTGFTRVISSTSSSATLQTYIYEVWDVAGNKLGWYPTAASSVGFAYTVLGQAPPSPIPMTVSISGTSSLYSAYDQGQWTAYATNPPVSRIQYNWYMCPLSTGQCQFIESHTTTSTSDSFSGSPVSGDDFEVRVVAYSDNQTAESRLRVDIMDNGMYAAKDSLAATQDSTQAAASTQAKLETGGDKARLSALAASEPLPEKVELGDNYPNPFSRTTTIEFALPESADVRLVVFDVMGREVARPADGQYGAGRHRIAFDAGGLPSGTYFYRLTTDGFSQTKRMVVLR